MRVLVTGGTGFIGRRVVSKLAADGRVDVVVSSRRPCGNMPATQETVDLLVPGAAVDLIERVRPTHLIHLAWNAQPGVFWNTPENLDWVASSLLLLRAFGEGGGQRAIIAGTCAEYDWTSATGRLSEDLALRPTTLYGASKDCLRQAAFAAAKRFGMSIGWGRIFWVYGPGEAPGRLVADVSRALTAGWRVKTSEGHQRRDFIYVDDVAKAFVAALDSEWNGAFNIGSGKATSVRCIVETLGRLADRRDLIQFGALPTPKDEPPLIEADPAILIREIGLTEMTSLDLGLAETLDWWRHQSDVSI